MSITGNVINVEKIQLTDTFQTWFSKTNEIIDTINPVNIYDIDDGIGTNVSFGVSGSEYNGVKYVNVDTGYGISIGAAGSGRPWEGVVSLDISNIVGTNDFSYELTGNNDPGASADGGKIPSEVDQDDYFVVLDRSDTTRGLSGTTKIVKAKHIVPRVLEAPIIDLFGSLKIRGDLSVEGAGANLVAGSISTSDEIVYIAVTGSSGAIKTEAQFGNEGSGLVIGVSGPGPTGSNFKEFLWRYNSGNPYWTFNTNYGARRLQDSLVNSRFISRNFVGGGGASANAFVFEAEGGSATRLFLSEDGSAPFFGIVKDSGSSNTNLNVYRGTGITSVAYIIAGATSQYPGITAQAFFRGANVDMLDGANAVTGASAWTIPVSDALGELRPDRHNAGQIKRRFTQTNHGLTTGEAVTVITNGSSLSGTLTGAQANSPLNEAIGIVDRVISNNEVSVTMKGYLELSANKLKGIGTPVTGQFYVLDWAQKGGLTSNTSVPTSMVYQPMFLALNGNSGIVYGNEGEQIFPNSTDEVYMRGMIPIGMIQPYAGELAGLTMMISGNSVPVSDIQYNENYLPCDGRSVYAVGQTGFPDLFNLIKYTYPMRGVVVSSEGSAYITIRPDRGTTNLPTLSLPSGGSIRAIKRSGTNSLNIPYVKTYTSLTANADTLTIVGAGITTNNENFSFGNIVDILSVNDNDMFFLPDMRGKSPFGAFDPLGSIGTEFNLGGTGGTSWAGSTGATAVGYGGMITNFVIRARREADALILTGHNHDSRYLRKDVNDTAAVGTTLNLQNLNVAGTIAANLGTNIGVGRLPATDTTAEKYPISWQRNGDFTAWMSGSNPNTGTNANVGYSLDNGKGKVTWSVQSQTRTTTGETGGYQYLYPSGSFSRPASVGSRSILNIDHGLSGMLINVACLTGIHDYFAVQAGKSRFGLYNSGTKGRVYVNTKSFEFYDSDSNYPPVVSLEKDACTISSDNFYVFTGDIILQSSSVQGNTTISLLGRTVMQGGVDSSGYMNIGDGLVVTGAAKFNDPVTFSNTATFNGSSADFKGQVTVRNVLTVTGQANMKNGLVVSNSSAPNIGTLFTGDDLHVGGRIQVGGLTSWNTYAISSKALTSGHGGVIGFTDRPPGDAGYGYGILGYRSGSTVYSFYGTGTLINYGSILPQSWANGGAAPSYIFTSVPSASSMPISGSVAYIV